MSRLGLNAMVAAVILSTSAAHAALVNQYTFNDGTANDSGPGAQHGTVEDPSGIARFIGGQLDLTANDAIRSDEAENGAYVDLPNGIVTSALQSMENNAASFEMWVTVETNRTWARLFDFGTSADGEGISSAGTGRDYLMMVPQGFDGGVFAFESHAFDNSSAQVLGDAPLPTGVEHHIVLSFDQNDTMAGPGGTASLYLNNNLVNSGPINEMLLEGELEDENNDWLGRSQWGADVLIDGSYNEFRIYDHALSASEVASNNAEGPATVPLPTLVVDRATGDVTIENQSDGSLQLTSYSITSAAGGLDVADSWDPIAPDNGWSIQTEADTEIAEMGGTPLTIDSGGEVTIGSAWIPSPIEDLEFSFEVASGGGGLGTIQFVGNGDVPFARSDLDTDGDLDVDDWELFLAGNGSDLSGLSTVRAYLSGDLTGDSANDHADFLTFRDDFIAANGAAAFAAVTGVPEPSALLLAAMAALGITRINRQNCFEQLKGLACRR